MTDPRRKTNVFDYTRKVNLGDYGRGLQSYKPGPDVDFGRYLDISGAHKEIFSTKSTLSLSSDHGVRTKISYMTGKTTRTYYNKVNVGPVTFGQNGGKIFGEIGRKIGSQKYGEVKATLSVNESGKVETKLGVSSKYLRNVRTGRDLGSATGAGIYANVSNLQNVKNTPENIFILLRNLVVHGVATDQYIHDSIMSGNKPYCFPASTLIKTASGNKTVSDIDIGDEVLAFDGKADNGRGELVLKRVTRLFRNVTQDWIKLTWSEGGAERELIATPGHHFLDQFGQFPTIEEMLQNGKATVVLASGELAEVRAERIVYSAETAHLFEQAESQTTVCGSLALKPAPQSGWQTYNFEVEDLHTYIAGGVRVHNQSEFASAVYGNVNHVANTAAIWDGSARGNATAYTNDGGLVRRDPKTGEVYHTNKYFVTTIRTPGGLHKIDMARSPGYGLGYIFLRKQMAAWAKGKPLKATVTLIDTSSPPSLDEYGYQDLGSGLAA